MGGKCQHIRQWPLPIVPISIALSFYTCVLGFWNLLKTNHTLEPRPHCSLTSPFLKYYFIYMHPYLKSFPSTPTYSFSNTHFSFYCFLSVFSVTLGSVSVWKHSEVTLQHWETNITRLIDSTENFHVWRATTSCFLREQCCKSLSLSHWHNKLWQRSTLTDYTTPCVRFSFSMAHFLVTIFQSLHIYFWKNLTEINTWLKDVYVKKNIFAESCPKLQTSHSHTVV